ncbi:uncharacterized protein UV8b_04335 [Ustilaginoidea virens]|uniref:Copper transport protein n=1 Tax=Ustilaginoidea virens TaxID=1159556 RepID=A0A063C7C6_USTVR|nr:uncharacterized protein UV8b_04335 [Ustilaginoidea virens]QUC20094.1 hypothetical protein UV8b_04335 [Ustilaginoidea virens]GAO14533.1 hypothetical protein UVI_02032440 [Ustilaginoidea virens]
MNHDGHAAPAPAPAPAPMAMVFQTDRSTPLYASSWTPASPGAYAATCVFLVGLAFSARLLLAARAVQEARWLDRDLGRRYVVARGAAPPAERIAADCGAKQMMLLSANGLEETVVVVARGGGGRARPWRFSVDPWRAAMDTALAGAGYLLMLAVMTMNVGYFMSVLAGVFAGSLAVGRYSVSVGDH